MFVEQSVGLYVGFPHGIFLENGFVYLVQPLVIITSLHIQLKCKQPLFFQAKSMSSREKDGERALCSVSTASYRTLGRMHVFTQCHRFNKPINQAKTPRPE